MTPDRDRDPITGRDYIAIPAGFDADVITTLLDSLFGDKMAVLDVPAMSLAGSDDVFMVVEMGEETPDDYQYKHTPVMVTDVDGALFPMVTVGMQSALMMLVAYQDQLTNPQGYLLMSLAPKFAILRPMEAVEQIRAKASMLAARARNGEPEDS